jgi:uncharacterized membrane protein YphA (DoxX/SURF4 family)
MRKIPFLTIVRIVLGAVFLWSGFLKLIEPWQNFQVVIEAYRMMEGEPVRLLARTLPWLEALGGLFLIFGLYTRAAIFGLWALNTVFLAALTQALLRKLPIHECGCFGDAFSLPLPVMMVVDASLWVCFGALYLWIEQTSRFSIDSAYKPSNPGRKK